MWLHSNENMLQVNWLKIVRALFLQCISALPKKKCCWKRINLWVITILVYFCLKMFSLMYVSYPRFTLLCGPSGFAPSQKQSRGVIMTQGRSCWIIYKRQGLFVKKCVLRNRRMFSTSPKKKKIMAQKFCIVTTEFANDHLRGVREVEIYSQFNGSSQLENCTKFTWEDVRPIIFTISVWWNAGHCVTHYSCSWCSFVTI